MLVLVFLGGGNGIVRLRPGDPAPSGPPLGPLRRPVERSGGPGKGRNLRQNRGGQSQGRRRGHCAAYITRDTITRVNHNIAHATREAYAARGRQGARHAHARPIEWWGAGCGQPVQCGQEWGTWASRTRKRGEAGGGRPLRGGVSNDVRSNQHNPGTPTTGHR